MFASACRRIEGGVALEPDEPLLRIERLSKTYDGTTFALRDISLDVRAGQFVSIIGSSGAGKSTLLRCINQLVAPTGGSICFDGVPLKGLRGRALRLARRRIAMIFQSYNLVLRSSVIQNVLHGRLGYKSTAAGALGLFSREDKKRAWEMLERVGMEDFAFARADQLSGGQMQRVGIARALVQEPALILADEPIASLDPSSARTVMELLKSSACDLGIACLVSLHQVEYALEFSDYIFGISQGQRCCAGAPHEFTGAVLEGLYEGEGAAHA